MTAQIETQPSPVTGGDSFVHLHLHTEYSLLDGACRIDRLMDHIKSLGQTAVAITDHGVMYGAIDFYRAAKKAGIHPVIGCEVYVAPRTRFDKVHKVDSSPHHLILLCENEEGYQNLIYLVSQGFIEGFYSKPRVDLELLRGHSKGLICLSACLAGEIPRLLVAGNYEEAKTVALRYQEIFGVGNYFLEVQDHGIPEQKRILPLFARLSRETGIGLVATNDAHYIKKSDSKMQNVLVCIQTNHTVDDPGEMEFPTQEFYVKSGAEMATLFAGLPGAVENTAKIAERCQLEFIFGQTKLPHFTAPGGEENLTFFHRLCWEGFAHHYGETPPAGHRERLEYELSVITKMGYVDYYLIVYDFIRHAKSIGIPVGPGRGSGAGSIAAYCVGITGIDPMKYGLLFERFLNPERVSMPDFDIDFCYERRQEVIDYVVAKYGSDHVSQIITFGTMAARGAIRDVGRALGMSYQSVDVIAKQIPSELGITLQKALEKSDTLRHAYEGDPKVKELLDMARALEGMPRHASTHAAGVVITRDPVESYVPLQKNDEAIVTQYPMTTLEELGLLKMDFLGLRNLTVIRYAQEMVRKAQPDFAIDTIPLDDGDIFAMLSSGQSQGVFQFESPGMCRVLTQLRPDSLEDLIAVISLYRPGPMESIPRYIQNRHNPSLVTYRHPLLKSILDVTYGCIVYQEQVMEICRKLAGYSYGRADLVRKAMSKKKADVMERERQSFIHGAKRPDGSVECVGAVANGVDATIANAIFDEMTSFASYAFNKAHAAAYAYLSYQTAYLKCHHPKEYMAALLTSVLENTDKLIEYIAECRRIGIAVLPPDITKSEEGFVVEEGAIRYGLLAVKNIGRGFIRELLQERASAPFQGFSDFCERMYGKELGKRAVESLIKCGAMDTFGHTRKALLMGYEELYSEIDRSKKSNLTGQINLFESAGSTAVTTHTLPDVGEYERFQLLRMEKETTGQFITGHPLLEYEKLFKKLRAPDLSAVLQGGVEGHGPYKDGMNLRLLCIIIGKKQKITKNGEAMAFLTVEDMTGSIEVLVFPKVYATGAAVAEEGAVVLLSGRLSLQEDEAPKIICDRIQKPEDFTLDNQPKSQGEGARYTPSPPQHPPRPTVDAPSQAPGPNRRRGLFLRVESLTGEGFERAKRILQVFEGETPVYVTCSDTGKRMLAPKDLWVSYNRVLFGELQRILGTENVVYLS